jgi:very-short-patch-repair endonuclease
VRGPLAVHTTMPLNLFNFFLSFTFMRSTKVARMLRRKETWAERLLWSWLRDRRFSNYKFRRQHPLGPYYLDFFCVEARVNIELNGRHHGHPTQQAADEERDRWLEAQGIKVLRFWNSYLRRNKQEIRDRIWMALQEQAPQEIPAYCRVDLQKGSTSES